MKKEARKTVWIQERTHRKVKMLSISMHRKMTCDLLDELLEIGMRHLDSSDRLQEKEKRRRALKL